MGKALSEIVKIIITALLSVLMTVVVLSGTVIGRKADKEYVDKQDEQIKTEFRTADKELKTDFLNIIEEIKEMQKESRDDIKELLKRKS
jgi:hypothetical protein